MTAACFSETWLNIVKVLNLKGSLVSPRGKNTKEFPQTTVVTDLLHPVLVVPGRKINYRFMAAEAAWILSGSDRVDEIAPWNSRIAEFSDDGVTLAGAYGKRIEPQMFYVVKKLIEDPDTRQAVMTIWTPNPAPSKDIPCTVAFDFKIRDGKLNMHVFMRSSDAWLGLPYDVFSFSMVALSVLNAVNNYGRPDTVYEPGQLYLTMASSHLYEEHWQAVADLEWHWLYTKPVPEEMWDGSLPGELDQVLLKLRESKKEDPLRWWIWN